MATGPWSVKGIDPRAREAAKAAAQRAGMTLGEWMNQRLLNDNFAPAQERARFTAPGSLSILGSNANYPESQDALEELTARLEAAERRSTLAITGIDQTVLGLLTRLEGMEKVHDNLTGKLENSLDALETVTAKTREEIDRVGYKVDRATEDTARRIDTVAEHTELQLDQTRHELSKELELVNNRSDELSQRLSTAERSTDHAVRALEASMDALEKRLRQTEKQAGENSQAGLSDTFNRRFKTLSEELIHVVAQTRGQLAAQIEAQAAAPRLEKFEASLRAVRGHIANSEKRHADTLERIAGEVGKLGSAIDHRFCEAERNTAISLDKMLDARFTEFQNDHASAIDKIGDGLTGAMTRLEEKLNIVEAQRGAEDSLEARIIASEERTAKMVEDALQRIQDRLDTKTSDTEDEDSPVQRAMLALAERLEALEGVVKNPPPFDPGHDTNLQGYDGVTLPDASTASSINPALEEVLTPPMQFDDDAAPSLPPLSPDLDTAPFAHTEEDPQSAPETVISPLYSPMDTAQYAPAGATADSEFLSAARRSVRMSGEQNPRHDKAVASGGSRKFLVAASVIAIITLAGAGGMAFMGLGKAPAGTDAVADAGSEWDPLIDGAAKPAQSAQLLNPVDAIAGEGQAQDPELDGGENQITERASINEAPKNINKVAKSPVKNRTAGRSGQQKPPVKSQTRRPVKTASAQTTITPTPQPTTPVSSAPLEQPGKAVIQPVVARNTTATPPTRNTNQRLTIQQAAANGDPIAQFQLASAKLDAGDMQEGVKLMQQAANRGLPIAQYRLGKLFEEGTGVPKDIKEARRWTERSANGGNRRAMHNLAMVYAEGNGLPQSYEQAAKWFQEAARMGLTNSQYNLAFLYEQGLGVPESLAQAFAWYSIAAKAGDDGAKARADEIGANLSPATKSEAEAIITSFRPRPLDLAANGIFRNITWARPQLNTAPSIARAQVLLARLGYKPGPADGNPGRSTRQAIIAYERDLGLAQTGRIDATLLAKLENSVSN